MKTRGESARAPRDAGTPLPLGLPFGALGAAVAGLAAYVFGGPVSRWYSAHGVGAALVAGGAVMGLAGVLLTFLFRRKGRRGLFGVELLLATCVLLASSALGGGVLGIAAGSRTSVMLFGVVGFLATLGALPAFVLVLWGCRRAARARAGSVVAASDRRAVWVLLALVLALVTLPLVLFADDRGKALSAGFLMTAVALLLASGITLVDLVALTRLRQVDRPSSELTATADGDGEAPRVDLGLGEEVRANVRGVFGYRSMRRVVSIVFGSTAEASAVLVRAFGRDLMCLAAMGLVLALHKNAGTTSELPSCQTKGEGLAASLTLPNATTYGCPAGRHGDVTLEGALRHVQTDPRVIGIDTSAPGAPSGGEAIARLRIDAPSGDLPAPLPEGAFVRVDMTVLQRSPTYPCETMLRVQNLPSWKGVPNPVDTRDRLWIFASDGSSAPDDHLFDVKTIATACAPSPDGRARDSAVISVTDTLTPWPVEVTVGIGETRRLHVRRALAEDVFLIRNLGPPERPLAETNPRDDPPAYWIQAVMEKSP